MLCAGCSTGTLKNRLEPRRANDYYGIQGYYCIKDTIEHVDVNNIDFGTEEDPFNFIYWNEDDELYYKANQLHYGMQQVSGTWYYTIQCLYYPDWEYPASYSYEITMIGEELENQDTYCQNFVIYVPQLYNIDYNNQATRFLTRLDRTANQYMTTYNGWYYLTTTNANTQFELIGNYIVDNQIYNFFEKIGKNMEVSTPSWIAPDVPDELRGTPKAIYQNNKWQISNRNIYISNVMIPKSTYQKMESIGIFAYVQPQTEQYSFSEFFFSIMDAPLYYIQSMFSWELFGVEVYVAFISMLTIVVILTIVKKVI